MIAKRRYLHPIHNTEPEVFIIESLSVEDEIRERFEGKALRDNLRISGQRPAYYYVRSATELADALELFRHSGFRFLHVSVHGSADSILTTLDKVSNEAFAEMCVGKLKNRRVFFSACEVGSGSLAQLLAEKNKGMYSISAPIDTIKFGIAAAFWMAFYTKVLHDDCLGMEGSKVKKVLGSLCAFFNVRLNWSWYSPTKDAWNAELIK